MNKYFIDLIAFIVIWIIFTFIYATLVVLGNIFFNLNIGWFICVIFGFITTVIGIIAEAIFGGDN